MLAAFSPWVQRVNEIDVRQQETQQNISQAAIGGYSVNQTTLMKEPRPFMKPIIEDNNSASNSKTDMTFHMLE